MSAIDLSKLPQPTVVESLDFETIFEAMKADALDRAPDLADALDLESEPATKLIEVFAYRELLVRQRVNDGALAVMLAYAGGADLDQIAARYGVERRDGETDAELRERVQLAPESLSVAGPVGAYEYHARSADARVADVAVASPGPGIVLVTVLGDEGDGVPPADLLDAVRAALDDERVRPLCDSVEVAAATVATYTVQAVLEVGDGPDAEAARVAAEAAVTDYVSERHRLGAPVTLSGLYAALHVGGVVRVQLDSPAADIEVAADEAAYCESVTVEVASG
mgnify:CR=1 FL=1